MQDNLYDSEFPKNLKALKLCNRIYKITFIIYAAFSGMYIFISLYFMLFPIFDPLVLFADGIILQSLYFAAALMGTYKKNSYYAAIAPVFIALSILFLDKFQYIQFVFKLQYTFISIGIAAATVITNKKYKWLEEQFGFPYFSQLIEEQKLDKIQLNIEDPYQRKLDELKKTQSSEMDSISLDESEK